MGKIFKRTVATIMVVLLVLTSVPMGGFVGMQWDWLDLNATATGENVLDDATKFNGHYYSVFVDETIGWHEAKEACEQMGGYLATITSEEENNFVYSLVSQSGIQCWLGATDEEKEGTWKWVTGEEWIYHNAYFDNCRGAQHYLVMNYENSKRWDDQSEKNHPDSGDLCGTGGYVCEWEENNKYTKEAIIDVYSNDNYDGVNKLPLVNVGTQLKDFTVTTASGSKQIKNTSSIKIDIDEAKQGGVKISKDYYQDYIIPADIFESIFNEGFSTNLKVKMMALSAHNAGYISTAFIKDDSEYCSYKDSIICTRDVIQASKYKIILSAVGTGSDVKYYLSQDDVHKISSSTGVFEGDIFSRFVVNKDIYAYATSSKGTTVVSKLKLNLVSELKNTAIDDFVKGNSTNILGDAPASIVGQTGNLFLEGATFDLSTFKVPISAGIDGNTIKVAIGIDGMVTYNHETKGSSTTGTKWKKDGEWSNFVKDYKEYFGKYKNISQEVAGVKEKAKAANDKAKALSKKYGKNYSVKKQSKDFSIDVIGYGIWEIVWRGDEVSLVFKEGSVILTGSLSYEYCQNGFVGPCPGYMYFGFGGSLSATLENSRAVADVNVPMQWVFTLTLEPEVTAGAGVGWKNWASLGLYGKASAPITLRPALVNKSGNLKIDVKGVIGVEATALFVFKTKKPLLDGSLTVVNKNWSKTKMLNTSYYASYNNFGQEQVKEKKMVQEVESTDRNYASETSQWLGSMPAVSFMASPRVKALDLSGMKFTTLQENVFYSPQTQVALVGDKVLMTYVEDDVSRSANNRMRLMYSLYDPTYELWSQPKPVSDDGKNDAYPYLVSDGENTYISWIKSNTLYPDDLSSTVDVYKACDVYFAKFDAENEAFTDITRITNDSVYDYNPSVAIDTNGNPVVYYASCTDNNTYGKNNTITKYDGIKTILETGKYYILSMTVNSDATELTYIMDKNGDTGDTTGVNAYTIADGTTTETNHEFAIADVFYTTFNGEEKLFYSDRTNIWYTNEDGEKTAVLAESTGISSSIHPVETDNGLSLIFTKNDGNTSELYVVSQTAEGWTAPVQISSEQKLIENVAVASNENKLYGCITTNEGGEINLVGFSFVNFTDITLGDIYISELGTNAGENNKFTVSVFNNGTNRVDSLVFTVSDTLGTNNTQTVEVGIEPGDMKQVELIYPTPENYSETTLTVSTDVLNDKNMEDNTATKVIGLPEITFTEPVIEENAEHYIITTYVENVSDILAKNVLVSVKNNENNLIEPIEYNELALLQQEEIRVIVPKLCLTYDEGYAKVVFTADCNKISESSADEVVAVLTNNSKNESGECAHIETEMKDVSATCKSEGKVETVCVTCGDVVSSITVSEKKDHIYKTVTTPATYTDDGKIVYKCSCGDSYTKIIAKKSLGTTSSITATKTTSSITLKWNKVSGANGYRVYRKASDGWKTLGYTTELTYTEKDLKSNSKYTYAVKAYVLDGKTKVYAPKYKSIEVTTSKASLGTTSSITTTQTTSSVTLKWNKVTGANGYRVYQKVDGKWKALAYTTNLTYTIKSLKANTKYDFAVRAYVLDGKTKVLAPKYKSVSATTSKSGLGTTSKITATKTSSSVTLNWNKVTGATGYRVYQKTSSGWKTLANTTKLTYTIKSLKANTSYTFAIRAYVTKSGKTTLASKYKSLAVTTAKASSKPGQVKNVKATPTATTVKLTWSKVSGVKGYYVFSYNAKTKKYTSLGKTTGTTYTVKKLKSNTAYSYAVQAYKVSGKKNVYGKVSSVVKVTTLLAAPTVKISSTKGKANLTWNNIAGESGYAIYMATSKNGKYSHLANYKANSTKATKSKLTSGKTYYFKVRAYKKVSGKTVYGAYSAVKSVKVK